MPVVSQVQELLLLHSRMIVQPTLGANRQILYSGVVQPAAVAVKVTGTPGCCGDATLVVTFTDVQGGDV